ncbi:MAG: putative DNA binding domain-containing protein [Ignavibacteria bacterium]|nr:putative DNA binding domain-containing protein [Ignavibacteria bacterium]
MEALELIDIISRGEDSKHQLKRNFTNPDSLAAEMVAFSNSDGGMIIIGVDDIGNITGLLSDDIRRLNQLISNTATNNVKNPINVRTEILLVDEKNVIIVFIENGLDKPYLDNNGIVWVKNGADKRRITSREELRRLFQTSDLVSSDKIIIDGTNLNSIDDELLSEFYSIEYGEDIQTIGIPKINYLENSKLAENGKINLAGLLLFGNNPENFKPEFIIKAINFIGNEDTSSNYRDSDDIVGNLKHQYENAYGFLNRNLKKIQGNKDINSIGNLEIPRIVLQEIIVNALIHRNYFIASPIRLFIFDDRIEIISPGILPNNLTIENIKNGISIIRNPILASFGTKLLPYRGIGTGIKRAIKSYPNIEFINDEVNNQFKVIIMRPIK